MPTPFDFPKNKRAMEQAWKRMHKRMTERDQDLFMKDLLGAAAETQATGKAEPVWDVFNSWYRTCLFRDTEGNQEALDWAAERSKAG